MKLSCCIGVYINDGSVESKLKEKIQLEIACTYLICDKRVVVYYNLDQNMCNRILPTTEETKKDQLVFREHFRDHFA